VGVLKQEFKEQFLKVQGWFTLNNKWHHPNLIQAFDLTSAWLYESFKHRDEDEHLFDSEAGEY